LGLLIGVIPANSIDNPLSFLFTIILGVYGLLYNQLMNLPSISRKIILQVSLVLNYFLARIKIKKVLVNL